MAPTPAPGSTRLIAALPALRPSFDVVNQFDLAGLVVEHPTPDCATGGTAGRPTRSSLSQATLAQLGQVGPIGELARTLDGSCELCKLRKTKATATDCARFRSIGWQASCDRLASDEKQRRSRGRPAAPQAGLRGLRRQDRRGHQRGAFKRAATSLKRTACVSRECRWRSSTSGREASTLTILAVSSTTPSTSASSTRPLRRSMQPSTRGL